MDGRRRLMMQKKEDKGKLVWINLKFSNPSHAYIPTENTIRAYLIEKGSVEDLPYSYIYGVRVMSMQEYILSFAEDSYVDFSNNYRLRFKRASGGVNKPYYVYIYKGSSTVGTTSTSAYNEQTWETPATLDWSAFGSVNNIDYFDNSDYIMIQMYTSDYKALTGRDYVEE